MNKIIKWKNILSIKYQKYKKHPQSSHRPMQTTPHEVKPKKNKNKNGTKSGPYPTDFGNFNSYSEALSQK